MYEPPLHRQDNLAEIQALIRARPFGLLISAGPSGLLATSIPFTFVDDGSKFGLLRGHVARANPVWKQGDGTALAIFLGPHAYVSPNWYPSKAEGGSNPWTRLRAKSRSSLRDRALIRPEPQIPNSGRFGSGTTTTKIRLCLLIAI